MQVIFKIECDLLGGCVGWAYGKIVLEMDAGIVRNRVGDIGRARSGFATIAQRFINQVCSLTAGPFRRKQLLSDPGTGEVGAKSVLAAFTLISRREREEKIRGMAHYVNQWSTSFICAFSYALTWLALSWDHG
jgi:hypothetical protein